MERRTMRIGKGIMTPGRILFLLLAISIASSWASPLRAEEPPRPVGYYVDAALSGYPSLASMRQRITMKRNEAIRAGALDDPKGWFAITNVPVRSWSFREEDMTGKEIGLSQMLPYPGKRAHAVRIVEKEKEQAEFDLAEMRNMLRADVKMAYAELSTVRAQADVVRQVRAVLEQVVRGFHGDVRRREGEAARRPPGADGVPEDAGDAPDAGEPGKGPLDPPQHARGASRRRSRCRPSTTSPRFPPGTTRRTLRAIYRAERPARQADPGADREGDAWRSCTRSTRASPDFEVSASYMQRDAMPDGTKRPDMFSAMVSMTLPIWRKGKIEPGIRAMTAEKEMAIRDEETLDAEAANAIGGALASLENFAAVAKLYRTTLIPQAEQSVQSNLEAYQVGKIDFPMLHGFADGGTQLPQGVRWAWSARCT